MVYDSVVEILTQKFSDYDSEDISADTAFDEIGAEYEDIIDLAFDISREFDIIIDEEDIEGVFDVGGLVAVVERLVNEK